jgi:trehalose utilization protein
MHNYSRSRVIILIALLTAYRALTIPSVFADDKPLISVLVWDEQQPAQKQAYDNFLGNHIAAHLEKLPGLKVRSVNQDFPDRGLNTDLLDSTDVIIWWGHVRQRDIKPEHVKLLIERIQQGRLGLIALHSAHWSTPFIEAMNERARQATLEQLQPDERATAIFEITPGTIGTVPKYDAQLTPAALFLKPPQGPVKIRLKLPNCCFPAYRADGKPSTMKVLLPDHPIARDLPREFENPQDEMYDEPFHIPQPDAVVLEERWASGEWFRSGSVWNVGQGKVFYYRPGHETFPVFKNPQHLKVIENTVRWMGSK